MHRTSSLALLSIAIQLCFAWSTAPCKASSLEAKKGLYLLHQGQVDEAIKLFEDSLRRDPNDLSSLLGLADAMQKKNPKKAAEYYKRIIKLDPRNKRALGSLTNILSWDEKSRNESMTLLKHHLEKNPNDIDSRRKLGIIASWQDSTHDIAKEQLKVVIEQNPHDLEALKILSNLCAWTDEWPVAEKCMRLYLERKPNDRKMRNALAGILAWKKHDHLASAEEYTKSLKIKKDPDIAKARVMTLLWSGHLKAAAPYILELVKDYPEMTIPEGPKDALKHTPILLYMARKLSRLPAYSMQAKDLFQQQIAKDPDNLQLKLDYAEFLDKDLNKPDEALAQLTKLSGSDSEKAEILSALGRFYFLHGQIDKAIDTLDKLTKTSPNASVKLWLQGGFKQLPPAVALALAYKSAKDFGKARFLLSQYCSANPKDLLAAKELQKLQFAGTGGTYRKETYEERLAKNPEDYEARLEIAYRLMYKSQNGDAASHLETLLSQGHDDLTMRIWNKGKARVLPIEAALAILYNEAGESDKAINALEVYLHSHPDDLLMHLTLADFLQNEESEVNKSKAITHLKQLKDWIPEDEIDRQYVEKARLKLLSELKQSGQFDEAHDVLDTIITERSTKEQSESFNPILEKASIYLKQKKHEDAENLIRKHYESLPEDVSTVHEILATAISRQESKSDEALVLLEDLITENPENRLFRQLKAELLVSKNLFIPAEKEYYTIYQEEIKKDKPDFWLCLAYARVLRELGKIEDSKQVIKKLTDHSDAVELHNFVAIRLLDLGETEEAVEMYKKMLHSEELTSQQRGELLSGLSFALLKNKQLPECHYYASQTLEHANLETAINFVARLGSSKDGREIAIGLIPIVMQKHPDSQERLDLLLMKAKFLAWTEGRGAEAIPVLKQYLESRPDDLAMMKLLADVCSWNNRRNEAVEIYNNLLELQPDNPEILYALARTLSRSQKTKPQALSTIDKYLANNSEDVSAWITKAHLLSQLGKKQEAFDIYDRLRAENPDNHRLILDLARMKIWHKPSHNEGVKHYKTFLEINPHEREIMKELADSLIWSRHRKQGLTIYKELLKDKPEDPQFELDYAQMLYRNHQHGKAIKIVEKAYQKNPTDQQIMVLLSQFYSGIGFWHRAEKILGKARELYPDSREVSFSSASNWKAMGRFDKALKEINRCKKLIEKELANSL